MLGVGNANTANFCTFTAPQQPLGGGLGEAVTVTVTTTVMGTDQDGVCDQSADIAASFLTAAGLR